MTEQQKKLSRRYIAYKTLTGLWFIGAVWLYFYRLFINDQQVGFLDGLAFAIGLIAEVPSGALADRFGRDKVVKLGQIMSGVGLLIQAFGSSFVPFFVGQAIMMAGASFVSGADEALFFEKLNFDKHSAEWRKLLMRASQATLIGTLFATITGGWLHIINPRIPWILTGISFICSALLIWSIRENRQEKEQLSISTELREYLRNIKLGFLQFRLPVLWLYVPIIITVQGLFYTTGWGLLRMVLLDRFHFNSFEGSIVIAVSSLISIIILSIMHKLTERLIEKVVIVLISLMAAFCLLISIPNIGIWGFLVILGLYIGERILYPYMSEVLNRHAPEDQRATVLSIASFFRTLPYVLLAPLIGFLNTKGDLNYFLIVWSILIFVSIIIYLSRKKVIL